MRLPLWDWQFLVVTFAALFCALLLLRAFSRRRRAASCGGCGSSPRTRTAKRVALTVQGRRASSLG